MSQIVVLDYVQIYSELFVVHHVRTNLGAARHSLMHGWEKQSEAIKTIASHSQTDSCDDVEKGLNRREFRSRNGPL